jgi:hypothetical protein
MGQKSENVPRPRNHAAGQHGIIPCAVKTGYHGFHGNLSERVVLGRPKRHSAVAKDQAGTGLEMNVLPDQTGDIVETFAVRA